MKALFGIWGEMKPADINRILKPHGVRLVVKKSKEWGKQVNVTAHATGAPAKRTRATVAADRANTAKVLGLQPNAPGQIGLVGGEESITVIGGGHGN